MSRLFRCVGNGESTRGLNVHKSVHMSLRKAKLQGITAVKLAYVGQMWRWCWLFSSRDRDECSVVDE